MIENNNNMLPIPTQRDITTALLITDRILLRQAFEKLKNRKGSKYFKHISIKNVPWGEITPIPENFPPEFKAKYPFDFVVEYTTTGCNALKCYKHDYNKPCKGSPPYLINNKFCACSEACYKVYDEFNEYLCENFKIKIDDKIKHNSELLFETFSIEKPFSDGSGTEECFCGMQLVDLKRFATLPSSRWGEKKSDALSLSSPSPSSTYLTQRDFFDIYDNHPTNISDMAGLVDSPPLDWNIETQNAQFNNDYCHRFRKYYDSDTDSCYKAVHRKVLGFLIGESVANQLSDEQLLFPIGLLIDQSGMMALNPGYEERAITQKKLELGFYTNNPDKYIKRRDRVFVIKPQKERQIRAVDALSYYRDVISNKVTQEVGTAVLEMIESMGQEVFIEECITASPAITLYLGKYFSKTFIQYAASTTHTTRGLANCALRIMVIVSKAVVCEVSFQLAMKCVLAIKSAFNIIGYISLLFLIPDILLSVYNVGGYNREINREQLNKIRNQSIETILKDIKFHGTDDDHGPLPFFTPLSYISIISQSGNEDDDDEDNSYINSNNNNNNKIVSPLITPELVYYMCLVNFNTNYPKYANTIGQTGLDPAKGVDLACEYLSLLRVNSVGQYLYDNNNDIKTEYDRGYSETPVSIAIDNIVRNNNINKDKIVMANKTPMKSPLLFFSSSSGFPTASQILDNSSEIIEKEIDYFCINHKSFDYKSTEWKYQCIGKNKDLLVLVLVIFLTLIIGLLGFIFSCKYCQYFYKNNYNKILTVLVCGICLFSLFFWFLYFGSVIANENIGK